MEMPTGEGTPDANVGGEEIDELFDVFRNRKRRFVLYRLHTTETPVVVGKLASELVAWKDRCAIEDVPQSRVERFRAGLYHNHLPKLAEADLVSFDRDQRTVELNDDEAVDSLVELTHVVTDDE